MTRITSITVVSILLANAGFSTAGVIERFPKDGTWVKYLVETKVSTDKAPIEATVTIRFVGTSTVKGEKCRWVEIERMVGTKRDKRTIEKFLVREKDFEIQRGWWASPKRKAVRIKGPFEGSGNAALYFARLKKTKAVKIRKVVDYQKGRFAVASGTVGDVPLDVKRIHQGPTDNMKITKSRQTVWRHDGVPCGTVELKFDWQMTAPGDVFTVSQQYTIVDFGTGAKSALPDQN